MDEMEANLTKKDLEKLDLEMVKVEDDEVKLKIRKTLNDSS